MNEILERIKSSEGTLTDEERAALEAYADSIGAPKVIWQVYDDSNIMDPDYLGTEKAGPQHPTRGAAINWADEQESITDFSIYPEKRCITRKLKIWYNQAASYSYSSW